jgi:fucose 4-O-acetylase-like acetyltransferase
MRASALVAILGLCYFLVRDGGLWHRLALPRRWSPMEQLGRTSLFLYWIHVEMAYGIFSRPLHKRLSFEEALLASALFMGLLLAASVAKTKWWDHRNPFAT